MNYIERTIESRLRQLVTHVAHNKNVILVEGARQVGKTCLVQNILKSISCRVIVFNLEVDTMVRSKIDQCHEFSEFQDLLEDEFGFSADENLVLFIDEAQESLKLGGFVRSMKEQWPKATVILTGSALNRLFRSDMRYPVGRITQLIVRPFSFVEYLMAVGEARLCRIIKENTSAISPSRHARLLALYDQYIKVGGLPDVVLAQAKSEDFGLVQRQLLASYEQDFIRLFGEPQMHIAQRCLRSAANHVGFPSKFSSVIKQPTNKELGDIKSVYSRLEHWHLILTSEQYGFSSTSSHHYLPKRYLFDTGLLRRLRETAVPSISVIKTLDTASRTPLGGILENQVACDFSAWDFGLAGWKKSSSGMEIDFVIKHEDQICPVECKAALRINRTHFKGTMEYLRLHKLTTGCIISFAPFQRVEIDGQVIFNIPAYMTSAIIVHLFK